MDEAYEVNFANLVFVYRSGILDHRQIQSQREGQPQDLTLITGAKVPSILLNEISNLSIIQDTKSKFLQFEHDVNLERQKPRSVTKPRSFRTSQKQHLQQGVHKHNEAVTI